MAGTADKHPWWGPARVPFFLLTPACIALAVGGWLVARGDISIGQLTAFTMYLGQLIWPMFAAGWVLAPARKPPKPVGPPWLSLATPTRSRCSPPRLKPARPPWRRRPRVRP